jgi:2'-5' RNA ligase
LPAKFTSIFNIIQAGSEQEQQFAIILFAPPEVSNALDNIRKRYDPAFNAGIPPHITLKRPAPLGGDGFTNLTLRLVELGRIVEQAASAMPLFEVELIGYDCFLKPDCNVVFLKIKDENPLCQLHMRLIEGLSGLLPDGGADNLEKGKYHPHLTIGNKLSDLELQVMQYEMASGRYPLNFRFTARDIGLLAQVPDQQGQLAWQTISHYAFNTVPAGQ